MVAWRDLPGIAGGFLVAFPQVKMWKAGIFLWVVFALVLAGIVAAQPDRRTVTPEYRGAAEKWWASEPGIYRGKSGFLYLPQAAVLYTPFAALPKRVGEPLWRVAVLSLLAAAIAGICKRLSPEKSGSLFFLATLLVIPASLSCARNGQNNLPLAAIYLLTATALAEKRWNLSAFFLVLSLALKPISLVPILLVAATFPATILPLGIGMVLLFASAFLHPSPAYVFEQYKEFGESLLRSGRPAKHDFCDFAGMFRTFGILLPPAFQILLRAAFAGFALWLARRTLTIKNGWDPAYSILLLAVTYLMLFNPRTESNSYVMLAAFASPIAAYAALVAKNKKLALWTVLLCLALASDNAGWPIFPLTNLWFKALVTSAFGVWVALKISHRAPLLPPIQT